MTTQTTLTFLRAAALLALSLSASGAPLKDDIDGNLSRAARPWTKPMHRLTYPEYEVTLQHWAEKYRDTVRLEKRGSSHDGMGVYLVKVTDFAVADTDKQVCLVTSLHGGPERAGSTAALRLLEWLIGDSREAAETRRKQVVLFMPIANPHAFFVTDRFGNVEKIDVYNAGIRWWDVKAMTLRSPEKTPELAAFLSVVDEYQPDVHTDLHGTGIQEYSVAQAETVERTMYEGHTMFEVTGLAYSNSSLRPWDWRITEAMAEAGRKAGYGSDRAEADAQRLMWGPDYAILADRLWTGRPLFYSAHYGYAKYHTMIMASEVGWEESGVVRARALLEIGNRPWIDERVPGYPVNRVTSHVGHFVTAYGRNASERRKSRVELWNKQGGFSQSLLYPSFAGRDMYVCAVNEKGTEALDADIEKFIANLKPIPGMRADTIEKYIRAGREVKMGKKAGDANIAKANTRVENGIGFRLRLQYRKPEMLDLRVNGELLAESTVDGYEAWFADGFTQVQINLPPEKARHHDLFVITCAYNPDADRSYGWAPPREVMQRMKRSSASNR